MTLSLYAWFTTELLKPSNQKCGIVVIQACLISSTVSVVVKSASNFNSATTIEKN